MAQFTMVVFFYYNGNTPRTYIKRTDQLSEVDHANLARASKGIQHEDNNDEEAMNYAYQLTENKMSKFIDGSTSFSKQNISNLYLIRFAA